MTQAAKKNDDDSLLTPEDLERLLKIPRATQAAMRARRLIPFLQIAPRTPRYRRVDIDRWLEGATIAVARRRGGPR